jgi:hypothetical protein
MTPTPADILELANAIDDTRKGWAWIRRCSIGQPNCDCLGADAAPLHTDLYTLRLIAWAAGQHFWWYNVRDAVMRAMDDLYFHENAGTVDAQTTALNIFKIVLAGLRASKGDDHVR